MSDIYRVLLSNIENIKGCPNATQKEDKKIATGISNVYKDYFCMCAYKT